LPSNREPAPGDGVPGATLVIVPAPALTAHGQAITCDRARARVVRNPRPRLRPCSRPRVRPAALRWPRSRPANASIYDDLASGPPYPVEGGLDTNDYAYVKDPINEFDLNGEGFCALGHNPKSRGQKHGGCRGGRQARAGARALDWSARCFSVLCIAKPLEIVAGLSAGYVLSGLAIWGGVAACAMVVGCVAGGWLVLAGGAGAAATTYAGYRVARNWRKLLIPRAPDRHRHRRARHR